MQFFEYVTTIKLNSSNATFGKCFLFCNCFLRQFCLKLSFINTWKVSSLFSNCLACSLHFQYGLNLCETRLCGSLAGSVGLILNWSGWNMGNEKDWWALSWCELTDVWWLAGVIGLLYGWSFTSGQEMHSACFQWSEGDWLTNCSLLESLTLLAGSPNWFGGMLW